MPKAAWLLFAALAPILPPQLAVLSAWAIFFDRPTRRRARRFSRLVDLCSVIAHPLADDALAINNFDQTTRETIAPERSVSWPAHGGELGRGKPAGFEAVRRTIV